MLRQLLLRLLLLSVVFTATVGTPLHEGTHLRQLARQTSVAAVLADDDDAPAKPAEREVDARCAWCASFADQFPAVQVMAAVSQALPLAVEPGFPAIGFVVSLGRWRFASRDPPV